MADLERRIPPAIEVRALVDTGASRTVVEESKLKSLGLNPTGETNIYTASSGQRSLILRLYKVELSLAEDETAILTRNLEVAAINDLSALGVKALLGRDVLCQLHLTYDGPSHHFTIQVPHA
jgi:predicted aspartyl protease